jgi:AcrR family transcriptional regulator
VTEPRHRERIRRSRQQSRDRIVAAATELIRRRSFAELSVEAIMREAGLAPTIFYRHFDDLSDLLQRAAREAIEELFSVQQRLAQLAAVEGPLATIPESIATSVDTYRRHGPLLRAMDEAAAGDERIASAQHALRARFAELATDALRSLPGFARDGAADPTEVGYALVLLGEAYLLDAFGREPRVSAAVAERTLTKIWTAVVGEA